MEGDVGMLLELPAYLDGNLHGSARWVGQVEVMYKAHSEHVRRDECFVEVP